MPLMHSSAILCLVALATVAVTPAEAAPTGLPARQRQVGHVSRAQIIRIGEPRSGIRTIGGGPADTRFYDSRRDVIRIGQPSVRGLRLGQNLPSVQERHQRWLDTGGFRR